MLLACKVKERDVIGWQQGSNVVFSFVYKLKSFIVFPCVFLKEKFMVWSGPVKGRWSGDGRGA